MKEAFLVVYDYGSGGVWAVIFANSKDQIVQKYPLLLVIEQRPSWMTEDEYRRTLESLSFDIDDPPTGWLLSVVAEQRKTP